MPPPPTPPKQIKNLKLNDIHKMDIKDLQKLDYQGLLKDAQRRPDVVVGLYVLPIVTLFVCFHIYSTSKSEQKSRVIEVTQLEEKIKIHDEYKKGQADLEQFLSSQPAKISENEFVDKITDLAVKNSVQIESFSPTKNQSDPFYDLTVINLTVNTKNYKDMWLFIHEIENSGLSIRINGWSGSRGQRMQGGNRNNRDIKNADLWINVRLEIAAVSFKK